MIRNVPPKSSSRRSRKRARKVQRILEAALDLVAEHGLEALTMKRLAERLDVAVGGLYYYFDSKDALVGGLERLVVEELGETFERTIALASQLEPPASALLALRMLAQVYQELPHFVPARFRLLSILLGDPRELLSFEEGSRVMAITWPVLQQVVTLFEQAVTTGLLEPGDPLDRTILFWASQQGVLQLQKLKRFEPERLQPGELLAQLVRVELRGFGADPETLDAVETRLKEIIAEEPLATRVYPTS